MVSGIFAADFALGLAFVFALGSAAFGSAAVELEDAPPLSAGAAAFLDAVFGLTSSICNTPLSAGGADLISKLWSLSCCICC